jgi:regulator of nucleoside diphosphate kinase
MSAVLANLDRLPDISLLPDDHERLLDLICTAPRTTAGISLLWREIERAAIISPEHATPDLVQLQSIVSFTDLDRATPHVAQLVGPGQGAGRPRVSVLTPVGAALIGLRAGDTFRWRTARGRRRALRVDEVAADPDAAARRRDARTAELRERIAELLSLA